ncbi:hypothetical protein SUDANB121_01016 [Nocardiopsis dassonvillei]|uniref:hypothetical protein n=1 Tax=Nocardiopsis dassonvillei TaxID=2014 RepID=UPI003F5627D4
MSESLYDFRAALSGEPETPVEGDEEQAELFTAVSTQETTSTSGSGGAPLSLNLATGLLMMTNRSGTVEVDTADERVLIDPESTSSVGRRDGELVLGATAEGTPLLAARAVRGEVLEPVHQGVPASREGSAEGVVTEPSSELFEAPVHVVSVRAPEQSAGTEVTPASDGVPLSSFESARMEPVMAGVPTVEAEPVSAPVEDVPVSAPAGDDGVVTGPVVTVDPETGETVILAEDLRITVGPENGQVRIEPSEENVPLGPDSPPVTVEAGGLTMVIDPATGTLEVNPIKGEFADVTVEIGDLRIVMDGETGEISVDPGDGAVSVDPETGLITIEPVEQEEDEDSGGEEPDGEGDRPGGDGEGEEEEGDGDRPGGDGEGVTHEGDHEHGGGRHHPDDEDRPGGERDEDDRDRPGGEDEHEGVNGRPDRGPDSGPGTVPGGSGTPVGSGGGEDDEVPDHIDTDGMYGPSPDTPDTTEDGPVLVEDRTPREDPPGQGEEDGEHGSTDQGSTTGGETPHENPGQNPDPTNSEGLYGPSPDTPDTTEDGPVLVEDRTPREDPPGQGEEDGEHGSTDQGSTTGGETPHEDSGQNPDSVLDPITGEGLYGPAPDPTPGPSQVRTSTVSTDEEDEEDEEEGEETDEDEEDEEGEEGEETDEDEEDEDEDEDEDSSGNGDGSGGNGEGSGGNGDGPKEGQGTKIDVDRLRSFQSEYVGKLDTALDEHDDNYSRYGSGGTENRSGGTTLLGNPARLPSAGLLAGSVDQSMSNLFGIIKGIRKELDDIKDRLEVNIAEFEQLEEGQVLNASQVVYLIGSPPGATGGGPTPTP